MIAVLLVVPGFLYTRLTLPDPHSISGQLSAVPRIVVRFCIASMVLVAAATAAASEARVIRIAFIVGTLLPLLSTVLLFRRQPYDLKDALGRMGAPKWASGHRPPQAPDRGARRSAMHELNSLLAGHSYSRANPSDALIHIHDVLTTAIKEAPSHVLTGEVSSNAGDYQTLVGPMLAFTAPDSPKRIAVWFSWQMEGIGEDLTIPVVELFGSFSEIGLGPSDSTEEANRATPNLEYLICRDVGNWVLRGRGKLSIPEAEMLELFGGPDLESAAARLCVSLEQAWKAALRRRGVRGVRELTVAWREWWLGHWA